MSVINFINVAGSPLIKELRENQRLTHHILLDPPQGKCVIVCVVLNLIYDHTS